MPPAPCLLPCAPCPLPRARYPFKPHFPYLCFSDSDILKRLLYILIFLSVIPLYRGCQKIEGPPEPDTGINFSGCIIPGTSTTLEVVTFNIERFPKQSSVTIDAVARLIKAIDPDIVALQEITSESVRLLRL